MSLQERVQAIAPRHTALLAELDSLAASDAVFRRAKQTLEDLKSQESALQQRVEELQKRASRQHADLGELKHSKVSRAFERVKGGGSRSKLEERIAADQRAFDQTSTEERDARDALSSLHGAIEEAKGTVEQHGQAGAKHQEVEQKLESLYAQVFDEYPPASPDEEATNANLQQAAQEASRADAERQRHEAIFGDLERARRLFIEAKEQGNLGLEDPSYKYAYNRSAVDDDRKRGGVAAGKTASLRAVECYRRAANAAQLTPLPREDWLSSRVFDGAIYELFVTWEDTQNSIIGDLRSVSDALSHTLLQQQAEIPRLKAARAEAERAGGALRIAKTEQLAVRRRIVLEVASGRALSDFDQLDELPPSY